MIVKAITFKTSSRYPTATARASYLEKDGRAVERSCQNVIDGDNPWRELDRTQARYELRGDVIAREYVLSPSPEDRATPAQMLGFAAEWTTRSFPSAEAVIVIHEDGRDRLRRGESPIPHAHVYVNAPDLETGRKITVSNQRAREIHDLAQEMSRDRGWSHQPDYFDKGEGRVRRLESHRDSYDRREQWQRLAERANPEYEASGLKGRVSQFEYERQKGGSELEKTFLRRSVRDAAREVASSPGLSMRDALAERGVLVERAADGDYKYAREGTRMFFKGKTLEAGLERSALERQIAMTRNLSLHAKASERGLEIG